MLRAACCEQMEVTGAPGLAASWRFGGALSVAVWAELRRMACRSGRGSGCLEQAPQPLQLVSLFDAM